MSRFDWDCPADKICSMWLNENVVVPAMRTLIQDEGMGDREAGRFVEKDSKGKVKAEQARQAYTRRYGTRVPPRTKPLISRTKPKMRKMVKQMSEAMEAGEIDDTDAQVFMDATAKSIKKGQTSSHILDKPKKAERRVVERHDPRRKKGEIEILDAKLGSCLHYLKLLCQGDMPIRDRYAKAAVQAIRRKGVGFIVCFTQLRVNPVKVYNKLGRKLEDYNVPKKISEMGEQEIVIDAEYEIK